MYQALYRKWRPKTFEDVAGQDHIVSVLQNQIQSGRISHAYLFTGSRGTGKTTCAKILAKAVNCLSPINGNPCNQCEICKGIDSGAITDVSEIDAASNNGVDSIRDLRDETAFAPANAKYRVFIIDEVHMLSQGAFNALLKTLEEPPAHVLFILATTEVHKIPATILSRCQRFDFGRIDTKDIAQRVKYVCQKEQAAITDDAALLISRIADGALRDALSLLDQCIIMSNNIDEDIVSSAAGLASEQYIFDVINAVRRGDIQSLLTMLDEIHKSSKDMSRLCDELISAFRSMMIAKTVSNPQDILKMPAARVDEYIKISEQFSMHELLHMIKTLQSCFDDMTNSVNRRIDMEVCLLKLAKPELDSSLEAISRRLAVLESAVKSGQFNTKQVEANVEQIKADSSKQADNLDNVSSEEDNSMVQNPTDNAVKAVKQQEAGEKEVVPLDCWPEILAEISKTAMPLHGVLGGSCAYVSGNYVLIDAPNDLFRQLITRQAHKDALKTAIFNQTGRRYAIGPYKNEPIAQQKDKLSEFADNMMKNGIEVVIK